MLSYSESLYAMVQATHMFSFCQPQFVFQCHSELPNKTYSKFINLPEAYSSQSGKSFPPRFFLFHKHQHINRQISHLFRRANVAIVEHIGFGNRIIQIRQHVAYSNFQKSSQ